MKNKNERRFVISNLKVIRQDNKERNQKDIYIFHRPIKDLIIHISKNSE